MAATRNKAPTVGTTQWVQHEREQAHDFVQQEVEEFAYSVRNEMDWLNEHMADIFSTSQVTFADVFKTPGKLRGKTPRTAHKRDALAPRQPLADIFAPNARVALPSPQRTAFYEKVAQSQIAEGDENAPPMPPPTSRIKSPLRTGKPYTDSGYHGLTEDEMDIDTRAASIDASSQASRGQTLELYEEQPPSQPEPPPQPQRLRDGKGDETGTSDESFVSAKEQESDSATVADADEDMPDAVPVPDQRQSPDDHESQHDLTEMPRDEDDPRRKISHDGEEQIDIDTGSPRSEGSSPEKPLQRKSSFTFSTLPAREPLVSKRSMGQVDTQRSSFLGKSLGARPLDIDMEQEHATVQETSADTKLHNKTSTQLLHERITMLGKTKEPRPSKVTLQSASLSQPTYPVLPVETAESAEASTLKLVSKVHTEQPNEDDDDDWIAPVKSSVLPAPTVEQHEPSAVLTHGANQTRPIMHQKSISTTNISSPKPEMADGLRLQKAVSIPHPSLAETIKSTTPAGSPTSKSKDGPLSASKNRLWSALKSAKNIFASSASASAAAKLEAHNTSPTIKAVTDRDFSGDSKTAAVLNMPGALYSDRQLPQSPSRPISIISLSPSRKTRSSSESERKKEKELKAQQKAAEQLEKAREKERQTAAKQQEKRLKAEKAEIAKSDHQKQPVTSQADRPESSGSDRSHRIGMPPPKTAIGKFRAPGKLIRPLREPTVSAKPAPVSIRVASQSQRLGHGHSTQSGLSKSQHDSMAPPPPPKESGPRVASAQGNRAGSTNVSNARVKALEAAARKKEADEKAAQKKAEQKKELERKRAAKAEEEKRAEEERKAAEQQRIHEAKLAAQRKAEKQAAEQKKREQERQEQQRREQERIEQQRREQERREQERLELQKREQERIEQQRRENEQLRQQEEARKAREAHELAEAIKRERAQQAQAHPRSDLPGTLRQLAKNVMQIPTNPAKPAKRPFPGDETDGAAAPPQRPGIQRGPPSYQQNEGKRRRTNEDQDEADERRSVMAPPRRPSTMRKDTLSKYPHGYTQAPSASHHTNSIFKSTITMQHQNQQKPAMVHPSQMAQVSNARIPFAENANPPAAPPAAASSYQQLASSLHSYETTNTGGTANKYKTPARPVQMAPKSAKSTPSYPNGDNIELPEIATDSEDEDEDEDGTGGFRAPSWVASPALRDLLTQQQLVDPETVFGPIAELRMDEVFKNSKNQERLKRFRDRGSSALWVESGDAVTSAEKRRDREIRERVAKDGGWRYEPGAA